MRILFVALALIFSAFILSVDTGYKIKVDDKFNIAQKSYYRNPGYKDKATKYKNVNLGPLMDETYIDDVDIKTLGDLKKYYPINDKYIGDKYWDKKISLKGAKYALGVFKNGFKMPVIVTTSKMVFSFLIEEGLLAFDLKTVDVLETGDGAVYGTVEIKKVIK
jgi:hypothetical protein